VEQHTIDIGTDLVARDADVVVGVVDVDVGELVGVKLGNLLCRERQVLLRNKTSECKTYAPSQVVGRGGVAGQVLRVIDTVDGLRRVDGVDNSTWKEDGSKAVLLDRGGNKSNAVYQ